MDKESLIEKYIHQELTETEFDILLKTAREDESFKEELELRSLMYADFKTDLKKGMLNSLRTEADTISQSTNSKTEKVNPALTSREPISSVKKRSIKTYIFLLAGLLLSAYLLTSLIQNKSTKKKIYVDYLEESVPQPTITKGDQIDLKDPWSVAIQQYSFGNYKGFLETLRSVQLSEEQRFYKGLALLKTNPPAFKEASIELASILESNPTGTYAEEVHWYLAIAHIANDENEKAQILLNKIISSRSWNHDKAEVLKSTLD